MAFFNARKSVLQVIVNGEVVLTSNPTATTQHHNSSGTGVLTGLSLTDYIQLPSKARITVTFSSQGKSDIYYKNVEGFLQLRRL
jgi:hypothetical protein